MKIIKKLNPKKSIIVVGLALLVVNLLATIFVGYAALSGLNKWELIAKLPDSTRKAGDSLIQFVVDIPYLKYRFANHGLPVYEVFIDKEDIEDLNAVLPDPNKPGYINRITSEHKIKRPARFVYNGDEYDVKFRYRGLQSRHWLWQKKSIRLIFDKPDNFEGNSKVDLIIAYGRDYVVDHFNNYRAKKLGLPAADSSFVWLKVNGKNQGVYYKTDAWGEEFLEKNNLDSNTNLYSENFARIPIWLGYDEVFGQWGKQTENSDEDIDNYADLALLLEIMNSEDEMFYKNIWQILDRDAFITWMVHSHLSGSTHQDRSHNVRLYFDKEISKFKFLPVDVGVKEMYDDFLFAQYHPLVNRLLNDNDFLLDFEKELWEYVSDENNLEEDLAKYDEFVEEMRIGLYQDRFDEANSKEIDRRIAEHRNTFENNIITARKLLSSAETQVINTIEEAGSRLRFEVKTKVKSNSVVNISNLELSGLSSGQRLALYEDSIGDGQLDAADRNLGQFEYSKNKRVYTSKIDKLVFPSFEIPLDSELGGMLRYPAITLDFTEQNYIITTDIPAGTELKNFEVKINFENEVIDSELEQGEVRTLDYRNLPLRNSIYR